GLFQMDITKTFKKTELQNGWKMFFKRKNTFNLNEINEIFQFIFTRRNGIVCRRYIASFINKNLI
ncbi:MAG: hypothetical protein JSV38_02670, partial [Desulfobacterales bacterium]